MPSRCGTALRIVGTTLFATVVLLGILLAYVTGYQFIHTEQHYLSFGLYGAILALHLFLQSLFAYLEHRRMRSPVQPQHLRRTVALCIAAYQEDPDYLRKCLRSVRRISFPGLKVVLVVDGNRPEDAYMMDIFQEVMGSEDTGSVVWKGNYHTAEGAQTGEVARVVAVVRGCRYSCIMQEWGGKREVMYTAFKALGDTVDYMQVSPTFCHAAQLPLSPIEPVTWRDSGRVSDIYGLVVLLQKKLLRIFSHESESGSLLPHVTGYQAGGNFLLALLLLETRRQ